MGEVIPYSLIPVIIGDFEVLARPIKWDSEIVDNEGHNSDGEIATVLECETVCPYCGQRILCSREFQAIQCPECGAGENISIQIFDDLFADPGEYAPGQEQNEDEIDEVIDEAIDEVIDEVIDEAIEAVRPTQHDQKLTEDEKVEEHDNLIDLVPDDELNEMISRVLKK